MEKLIQNDNKDHWSYSHYQNIGLNSICSYPAMMIDEMQKEILEKIVQLDPELSTLFDPFHGAGTTLIIAKEMGLDAYGIDINPLASLISDVKLFNYDYNQLSESIENLKIRIKSIRNSEISDFAFYKIEKWFREDIIHELTIIRNSIIEEENEYFRKYFWVCFSDIIRKFSNTRSTTFKLHLKIKKDIDNIKSNVIIEYFKKIDDNLVKIKNKKISNSKYHLWSGNSLDIMKDIEAEKYDIILTSPPYGDNLTTVTYGQFSTLQLRWIDSKDLKGDVETINQYFTSIDTLSLGGRKLFDSCNLQSVNEYVDSIHESKRLKVINFMCEYEIIFSNISRILKKRGFLVITLGNRRVDNKLLPFNKVHEELSAKYGLEVIQTIIRKIGKKRMAYRLSKDREGNPINSISEEYIMIFRKKR